MDAPDAKTDRAEARGVSPAPTPTPASLWAVVADETASVSERVALAAEPARHGHRHGRGHRHGHRHRATPRPAKLAWWHVALVVLVGLLVTYLVIHLAAGQAAPPPD